MSELYSHNLLRPGAEVSLPTFPKLTFGFDYVRLSNNHLRKIFENTAGGIKLHKEKVGKGMMPKTKVKLEKK